MAATASTAPPAAAATATAATGGKRAAHVAVRYDSDDSDGETAMVAAAAAEAAAARVSPTAESLRTRRRAPPADWRQVWTGIEAMRSERAAPVDSMGCAVLSDEVAQPEVRRFQTLVSLMLSSQTKDQMTARAMANLRAHGCTVDNIIATSEQRVDELIAMVCFHNRKASYIKRTVEILKRDYRGDIPDTLEKLMDLPGVGPKMAHLCMQHAWDICTGIGVDVHVHRISNRLGWVKNTNEPEKTRMALEAWLPYENWRTINVMLVGFGQTICLPVGPRCGDCRVNRLCPVGRSNVRLKRAPKASSKAADVEQEAEPAPIEELSTTASTTTAAPNRGRRAKVAAAARLRRQKIAP